MLRRLLKCLFSSESETADQKERVAKEGCFAVVPKS